MAGQHAPLASFEFEPGLQIMLLDAQTDILSAAGDWPRAEALFEQSRRLHDERHHFGTSLAYPYLARRLQHELRAGQVAQAEALLALKRKISGPTRSLRGDQFLARGFSVHETCLRQGMNLWAFMHEAVAAWIAHTAPPSMVPRTATAVPTG